MKSKTRPVIKMYDCTNGSYYTFDVKYRFQSRKGKLVFPFDIFSFNTHDLTIRLVVIFVIFGHWCEVTLVLNVVVAHFSLKIECLNIDKAVLKNVKKPLLRSPVFSIEINVSSRVLIWLRWTVFKNPCSQNVKSKSSTTLIYTWNRSRNVCLTYSPVRRRTRKRPWRRRRKSVCANRKSERERRRKKKSSWKFRQIGFTSRTYILLFVDDHGGGDDDDDASLWSGSGRRLLSFKYAAASLLKAGCVRSYFSLHARVCRYRAYWVSRFRLIFTRCF